MFDDFLVRAIFAGIGAGLGAGPLGCFIVWRRMAYFGDATAHAAILGVALSLGFGVSIFIGTLGVAIAMAMILVRFEGRGLAMDTLLGVFAHGGLAVGLVVASFNSDLRLDLSAYLFGDILAVGRVDLLVIWGGSLLVIGLLCWRWNALLMSTLNVDLAASAGARPRLEKQILTLCLAVVVAVSIKILGALLIGAMLIIPAAAARPMARSPEVMALLAAVIGAGASLLGLYGAHQFDTPAGPSIVCAALGFVVASSVMARITRG
ncbi:metal ABC transporter permease [Amylibacter marinus]|nr:metal ABC transporter permease [Amylibacter marinus]